MKLKLRRLSPETQFERLKNFASEAHTINFKAYYVLKIDLMNGGNVPLYIIEYEEVLKRYLFSIPASDFVRENGWGETDSAGRIILSPEFMGNFDLIRIVPPDGIVPDDSYLRIVKKGSTKWYTLDDLLKDDCLSLDDLIKGTKE
jgi:hypothetical protein